MKTRYFITVISAAILAVGALAVSAQMPDLSKIEKTQSDDMFSPVDKMPGSGKKDPNAKPSGSTALRDLGYDSLTLCRDQGTLINRVETIKTTLKLTAGGLAMLSVLEADLRALELSVDALYLSAQTAEVIPQARPKVKPIKESLASARVSIKKARVTMTAITTKTEPIRVKLKTAAETAEKVELGLTVANTIPCKVMPESIKIVKGCLAKMPAEKKDCVAGKVEKKAETADNLTKDYDAIVRVLIYHPEVSLPNLDFVNPFNADLKALEDLRAKLNDLTSRLNGLASQLGKLNAILDQSFSFSFPYPNPTITDPLRISYYSVGIGFRTIIEGAGAIEKAIEDRLSGFLWGVLKGLGVDQFVKQLESAANSAVNALLDAVNFNVDVNLPSLDALDALKLDEVVLESGLDSFKLSVDSIDLKQLNILPRLLNPAGLSLDDPDFCGSMNFGCK